MPTDAPRKSTYHLHQCQDAIHEHSMLPSHPSIPHCMNISSTHLCSCPHNTTYVTQLCASPARHGSATSRTR
jgi:hypothetical protein